MASAPSGFGSFGGDLLIGNVRDSAIHAYDPATGASEGQLTITDGNPIQLNGLCGCVRQPHLRSLGQPSPPASAPSPRSVGSRSPRPAIGSTRRGEQSANAQHGNEHDRTCLPESAA